MNDLLKIAKSLQDNNIKETDVVAYYTETLDFILKAIWKKKISYKHYGIEDMMNVLK